MTPKNKINGLIFVLGKAAAVAIGFLLLAFYPNGKLSAPLLLIYVCTESFLAALPFFATFWLLSDFKADTKTTNRIYKLLFSIVFAIADLAMMALAVHLTGGV